MNDSEKKGIITKNVKEYIMSDKKAKIQQGTIAPVTNPEVKKAINDLKQGSTPERQ